MRTHIIAVSCLLGCLVSPQIQAAPDCSTKTVPQPLSLRPTALPPLAPELPGSGHQLGEPRGVLALAYSESQSVDRVLLRMRLEGCQNVAHAPGYVPRTQWDNGPWRFNAGGEGKKFSAAEFDAWMKSRGVRVVKAKATEAPAASVAAPTTDD